MIMQHHTAGISFTTLQWYKLNPLSLMVILILFSLSNLARAGNCDPLQNTCGNNDVWDLLANGTPDKIMSFNDSSMFNANTSNTPLTNDILFNNNSLLNVTAPIIFDSDDRLLIFNDDAKMNIFTSNAITGGAQLFLGMTELNV
ncbi:hypothetical protein PST77_21335, partial [Yersinia pestis]|nr:hypothetical protein [Yersinia pestis]